MLEVFGPRVGLFIAPVISPIIPNVSLMSRELSSFFVSHGVGSFSQIGFFLCL